MPAYNAVLEKFAELDAQVVGISVDSVPNQIAWQKRDIGMLRYPLVSDFYPHGEVAQKYGVLRLGEPIPGICERAIFVIDKGGRIVFSRVYHLGQTPDNAEVLEVLRGLQAKAARCCA